MHPDDIILRKYGYPESPTGNDSNELNLTDEQQSSLKEFMCCCTPEQLRCAADCLNNLARELTNQFESTVTVDDFEKAKSSDGDSLKEAYEEEID